MNDVDSSSSKGERGSSRKALRRAGAVVLALTSVAVLLLALRFSLRAQDCASLSGLKADECYLDAAPSALSGGVEGAIAICGKIESFNLREACLSLLEKEMAGPLPPPDAISDPGLAGLALAHRAKRKIEDDPSAALASCRTAAGWDEGCIMEVAGAIAKRGLGKGEMLCHRQKDPAVRGACYRGIGRIIGRTDPAAAQVICNLQEDDGDRHACLEGLGFALARGEDPRAAVQWCEKFEGPDAAACLRGIRRSGENHRERGKR